MVLMVKGWEEEEGLGEDCSMRPFERGGVDGFREEELLDLKKVMLADSNGKINTDFFAWAKLAFVVKQKTVLSPQPSNHLKATFLPSSLLSPSLFIHVEAGIIYHRGSELAIIKKLAC
jgi:hypothetical protein